VRVTLAQQLVKIPPNIVALRIAVDYPVIKEPPFIVSGKADRADFDPVDLDINARSEEQNSGWYTGKGYRLREALQLVRLRPAVLVVIIPRLA